ncbi:Coiled-coil domain-containing protein [Monoraphidium neglectum]|uniref:Coiled-coil domain-containing protein n=1 Tax=Monoraphidium neglectum TaxID=145388 RepID=A0A0D2K8T6_9CHLO|nr:Coiled-coil domain-containing protein [Monoraphidium neglectum]KIZ06593.1 Coiled-coil domain-containing protein [Monoraphidium neglectum]|eukprot:XP_013905612.1 Coiled-coil domain-containing protein [Monoraphidium neglectum]
MSMWMSRLRLGERIAPASDHPPRAPCLLVAAPQESKAKESIAALKAEVTHLQRLAEAGQALSSGEEATLAALVDQILAMRSEMLEVAEKISEKRSEAEREGRKRERLEKEARELKASVEARTTEARSKQVEIQAAEEQVARLEGGIKEAKAATDKVQKEYNALSEKVVKLHHDLEEQVHHNSQLMADNGARQVEIRAREEELAVIRAEVARVNKVRDAALKKTKAAEEAREALEAERDSLRSQIASLERDVAVAKQEGEAERRKLEDLKHERDILLKMRSNAENATSRQSDLVRVAENTRKNLENEINGYRAEAARMSKSIWSLEKEREKYSGEAAEADAKYQQVCGVRHEMQMLVCEWSFVPQHHCHGRALEEVKVREVAIVELQKRISEGEGRLKQQQALYEAVRADRNLYSKTLIEAQDEISELKRKFKIQGHQVDQLKEEIGVKDLALVKEHFDHMKVEKEKDALRMELTKARAQIGEADAAIGAQKSELDKLKAVVVEADAERLRQRKEYDLVMGERDILGSQLIRRNDELALLYEKVKLQGAALARGAVQYRDRVSEIRVLKVRLADLRRQLHVLRSGAANVDVLKREVTGAAVAALGRSLLAERTKVKALSEELENPLNVHRRVLWGARGCARWRKLEGSDPSAYEMIQKIQALQKRLIAKTEEAVEKDMLIQEKERLYVELKNILARQPGPEVAEQVALYQGSLRGKTKQLKAMASELNMAQAQVAEYRYEIERLAKELGELKKRWFDAKRREQQQQQHQQRSSGGGGGTGAQKQQQSGGAAGPAGGGSRDGGLGVAAAGQAVKGGGAAVV